MLQCASFGSIQSRMLQCASVVFIFGRAHSRNAAMRFGSIRIQRYPVRLRLSRYASVRGTEMVGAFVNVICHLDRALDPVRGVTVISWHCKYLILSVKADTKLKQEPGRLSASGPGV